MQSTARHGVRILLSKPVSTRTPISQIVSATKSTPWTCTSCRLQARSQSLSPSHNAFLRTFTASARRRADDDERKRSATSADSTTLEDTAATSSPVSQPDSPPTAESSLPSHAERRRWQLSKDMTTFVDQLLARASIAGQHINAYTGTDYSGIETLRKEIIAQEQKVRECHRAVDEGKDSHAEAYQKQSAAQKEIVGLLERKSSWSPTDLERYMTLVRSEHVHDQAVQAAKDTLAARERELEGARAMLERLERKQYHEEQIWSDTIRRNSTWVTFGLMGFNIVLLLAQILIFEPYRRRKIVREVKVALDEKTLSAPAAEAETQVDDVVEPAGKALEAMEKAGKEETGFSKQPLEAVLEPSSQEAGETPLAAGEVLPEEAVNTLEPAEDTAVTPSPPRTLHNWQDVKAAFIDLFSERLIQIKQVELTTVALQGAATGIATMGVLFLVLRPR